MIEPFRINFGEFQMEIKTIQSKKMYFKMSSAKNPPFCRGLNMLTRFDAIMNLYAFVFARRETATITSLRRYPGGGVAEKWMSHR